MLNMNKRSLNAHADASVKKYAQHHFSVAWTGRDFPSTGHPDLPTSHRFTHSQPFTYKNTLRSSEPARIWNTRCITSLQ